MLYLDMLSDVLSEAEGCPEETAMRAMRDACIAWAQGTYCLTVSLPVTTTAEAPDDLPVALDAQWAVAILSARIAGEEVSVLAANDPATEDATAEYPAIVYADPDRPYVVPPPTVPVDVELFLAVAPGQESTEIPDFMWQRWREALIDGALARLLAKRGKPWSDPQEAERRRLLFELAKTQQAMFLGRNRLTSAQRLRVTPV